MNRTGRSRLAPFLLAAILSGCGRETGKDGGTIVRRLEGALNELSRRVGFRVANGLSERVIYRELFPAGLTLLDKGHLGELGTSHLVARQELRAMLAGLNLPMPVHITQQPFTARLAALVKR